MKQRVTVLGSTGSVGTNTLDVIARHPDRFEVFALSAATKVDAMLAQCARFRPQFAVMASPPHGIELERLLKENGLPTRVAAAPDAIEMIASHESVDAVMAAIVGAAGLAMDAERGIAAITTVGTVPEARHRGVAQALVVTLAERAQAAGCDLVYLVARAEDTPKEMYRKLGFEVVHGFDVWLRPPQ